MDSKSHRGATGGRDDNGPIIRAFRLLRTLVEAERELSGKEISERLNLPPSTVHRFMQILVPEGMVARHPINQKYMPGAEFQRMALASVRRIDVVSIARPYVEAVVRAHNVTCALWLHFAAARLTVPAEIINSTHPLDFRDTAFGPRSLVWGASARAILAFLSDAEVDLVMAEMSTSPTGLPPAGRERLLEELRLIRQQGHAFSESQTLADAIGIAAPVFDHKDAVIGCVGATVPTVRFHPRLRETLAESVKLNAARLSSDLGSTRYRLQDQTEAARHPA